MCAVKTHPAFLLETLENVRTVSLLHISMEDFHSSFHTDNKVFYPFCLVTEVGYTSR